GGTAHPTQILSAASARSGRQRSVTARRGRAFRQARCPDQGGQSLLATNQVARNPRTLASNSRGLKGLVTYASQPASRPLYSSSVSAYEVTAMMGMARHRGSALMRRVAS